jgi:hypothetical protein
VQFLLGQNPDNCTFCVREKYATRERKISKPVKLHRRFTNLQSLLIKMLISTERGRVASYCDRLLLHASVIM